MQISQLVANLTDRLERETRSHSFIIHSHCYTTWAALYTMWYKIINMLQRQEEAYSAGRTPLSSNGFSLIARVFGS